MKLCLIRAADALLKDSKGLNEEARRSEYIPFNLVCLFARTRKNVCKRREKERKRGNKDTLEDAGSARCAPQLGGGSRSRGLFRMRRGQGTVNKPTSRLFSGSSMPGPGSPRGSKLYAATQTNVRQETIHRQQLSPQHVI